MDEERRSRLDQVAQQGALAFRRQVHDVFALLAMAAQWRDRTPELITRDVLDLLVRVLRLDVAAVRICGPEGWLEARFPDSVDTDALLLAARGSLDSPVPFALPQPHPLKKTEARLVATQPIGEDGLAVVGSWREDFPTPHELLTFRTAIDQAAVAMQSARESAARAGLARKIALLTRIHALSEGLSLARSWREVAEVTLDQAVAALGASAGLLYRVTDESLVRVHAFGSLQDPRYDRIPLGSPLSSALCLREGPLFLEAERVLLAPGISDHNPPADWGAVAALPLQFGERSLGVLLLAFDDARPFPEDDRECLIGMGRQAALAADRVRLVEAERAARDEVDRRKDEFLAMLGHELRNPLAPITTAVALMKRRDPSVFERERQVIERQTAHMSRLVDDLLDISRITHGRLQLNLEPVELGQIVTSAIDMVAPLLERQRHQLSVSLCPEPLLVSGDPARLAQIVANVLHNAAKYTPPEGHVRVELERDGENARIRVRDDGIGMKKELLDSMFEAFVQERRAIDRSQGGLGLGLAIVRSLTQLHQGEVSARSEGPGKGTEVTVALPLLEPRIENPATPHPPEPEPPPSLRATRVLVVDDNVDAAELLGAILCSAGYEVCLAHDGLRALEAAEWFAPQIGLLDIGLPVLDGYELAGRLRANYPRIELLAVTGYGAPTDRRYVLEAGFAAHLVKPVSPETLLLALRERERAMQRGEARVLPWR